MSDTTLPALRQKFNRTDLVHFAEGVNGLVRVEISAPGGTAEVYLHGAHVTQYQPDGERPVFMLSRKSAYQADKPIRGGVPICWPWFGPRADDPKAAMHGFARLMVWDVERVTPAGDAVELVLAIRETPRTLTLWPHKFRVRYTVTVGRSLRLALEVTNTDDKPFTFTEALHPYFQVSDVRNIEIEGLENTEYSEKIYAPEVQKQGGEAIRFGRRTDRVYYATRNPLTIKDPGLGRKIVESKENSETTVVWNPWDEWPKTVSDFAEDEWPGMVCVEPSNAHHFGVTLKPGESHTMRAAIEVHKL